MMRSLLGATCILITAIAAHAEMDTQTRRDFIAACMFSGGFTVEGREPELSESNGEVDVERTVKSWVDAFEVPEDKLLAGREIRACLQQILDASRFVARESRVEARGDALYAEMALTIDPLEYAKGIVCKRPDIRQSLALGAQMRQLGASLDPNLRAQLDQMLGKAMGINTDDPVTRAIMNIDFATLDCTVERICDVRGSVPVDVLTDTMYIFDIPMRQVAVHAGQCEGKNGFINERFITF